MTSQRGSASGQWLIETTTTSDIVPMLTGERMMTKYTGSLEAPSRDEIARLAYHFYERRGRRDGQDVDDWLAAEQKLTRRYR